MALRSLGDRIPLRTVFANVGSMHAKAQSYPQIKATTTTTTSYRWFHNLFEALFDFSVNLFGWIFRYSVIPPTDKLDSIHVSHKWIVNSSQPYQSFCWSIGTNSTWHSLSERLPLRFSMSGRINTGSECGATKKYLWQHDIACLLSCKWYYLFFRWYACHIWVAVKCLGH